MTAPIGLRPRPNTLPSPLKGLSAARLGWRRLGLNAHPTCARFTATASNAAPTSSGASDRATCPSGERNGSNRPTGEPSPSERADSPSATSPRSAPTTSSPNAFNSTIAPTSRAADERSWLRAICPCSRASWRRRGVGASVFSPNSSDIGRGDTCVALPYLPRTTKGETSLAPTLHSPSGPTGLRLEHRPRHRVADHAAGHGQADDHDHHPDDRAEGQAGGHHVH